VADTPGQRLYLIRLALGDGVKNPMPLSELSRVVKEKRRASYDPSTISRMENGTRTITIEDVQVFAPLDPRGRGLAWLAFGDEPTELPPDHHTYTFEEIKQAEREAELIRAHRARLESPPADKPARRGKAGGSR
jgi:hypothetical protein